MIEIKFYIDEKKSVAYYNNIEIGECCFVEEDDTWNIIHTFVKSEYQGMGIAKKLVECVKKYSDYNHKKLKADCMYAKKIISR